MVGVAVVCFVVLVWAQAFRQLPLLGSSQGGPNHASAVSSAQAPSRRPAAAALRAGSSGPASAKHQPGPTLIATNIETRSTALAANRDLAPPGPPRRAAPPEAGVPSGAGEGSSGAGASPSPSEGKVGSTAVTAAPGGGGANPSPTIASGGGGAAGGELSSVVGGVVNDTVSEANQTVSGAISQSGATAVSGATLGAVGASGPTVGHAVDETVQAVGGLLHGSR